MVKKIVSKIFLSLLLLPSLALAVGSGVSSPSPKLYSDAVRADLASTASGKGAAMVGFKGVGAGAVARTQAQKDGDFVSVLDHGAVGDGVADDTDEINSALLASRKVYFPMPAVHYKISGTLNVQNGQVLIGDGKAGAGTFRGIYANMTAPIFTLGDGVSVLLREMSFQNMSALNDGGAVIVSRYSTNWNVFNSYFKSNAAGYNTVDMEQSYRISIYNSDILKSGAGWALSLLDNSNGILVSGSTLSGGSAGGVADIGRSYNITFDSNVFEVSKYGIQLGTNPSATKGGECNGVNLRGNSWEQYTIALEIGTHYACHGVVVQGNFFSNSGEGFGLAKDTMIRVGRVSGLDFRGNVLTPHATEYVFDFWHAADLGAGTMTVHGGSIVGNEYTSSGAGYKFSGYYTTYPSLMNRIPKGLLFEFGNENTSNDTVVVGARRFYDSGKVLPSALANFSHITATPVTGAYIDRVELIRVDPAGDLGGVLTVGYTGDATYNASVPLVARAVTGAANNGGGLVRVTSNGHGYINGQVVTVSGVVGTVEANGSWVVAGVTANTFDLVGSAFVNAYVSGGSALMFVWVNTAYGYYADITALLKSKFCVVSDQLLSRVSSSAGTGTIQIKVTYRQ